VEPTSQVGFSFCGVVEALVLGQIFFAYEINICCLQQNAWGFMRRVPKEIKIKLRPGQIEFIEKALSRWAEKCPLRFSEPELKEGVLRIDPHDFMELSHYIEKNFENELEVRRLGKTAAQFLR
jgi:hypothetical protein